MNQIIQNNPDLWRNLLPFKSHNTHKYDHGHALIYGAPELTGATRLAAEACSRIGAGLVTVLSTPETSVIYRETLAAHILVRDDLTWDDARVTARLYGSGGLPCAVDFTRALPTVLDAEALFELPSPLIPAPSGRGKASASEQGEGNTAYVLTPHEGEFARAFPEIKGDRPDRARAAARQTGAVVILKGPETLIAAPDGQIIINTHASPHLATAGTGDVLAGMVTGLLAQKMDVFKACCAAVWIHGDCALKFGPGLVASDLPGLIPRVLQDLS